MHISGVLEKLLVMERGFTHSEVNRPFYVQGLARVLLAQWCIGHFRFGRKGIQARFLENPLLLRRFEFREGGMRIRCSLLPKQVLNIQPF